MAGEGKIEVRVQQPWQLTALLYNFDIDSSVLKPQHLRWLEKTVLPYYSKSRSMETGFIGMASRTGPDEWNYRLSRARAASVESLIWRKDPQGPRLLTHYKTAVGEEAAALNGQANGAEDERYRAVLLTVSDPAKKLPIPPPAQINVPRRVRVHFGLTEKNVGISARGDGPEARRAEASRRLAQGFFDTTPLYQTDELTDITWTVTVVTLKTNTLRATVAGSGNVSQWLDVTFKWEPWKTGQKRFLVKDGVTLRQIDFDEMSDWYDAPLKTYRRYW